MLNNAREGERIGLEGDVYEQVATACKGARPKIQKWIEQDDGEKADMMGELPCAKCRLATHVRPASVVQRPDQQRTGPIRGGQGWRLVKGRSAGRIVSPQQEITLTPVLTQTKRPQTSSPSTLSPTTKRRCLATEACRCRPTMQRQDRVGPGCRPQVFRLTSSPLPHLPPHPALAHRRHLGKILWPSSASSHRNRRQHSNTADWATSLRSNWPLPRTARILWHRLVATALPSACRRRLLPRAITYHRRQHSNRSNGMANNRRSRPHNRSSNRGKRRTLSQIWWT